MILELTVSVEHQLVTNRQTHNYGIYRANMAKAYIIDNSAQ